MKKCVLESVNGIEDQLWAYIFAESNKVNKVVRMKILASMSRIRMHLEREEQVFGRASM